MNTYQIAITEKQYGSVTIMAETQAEARARVNDMVEQREAHWNESHVQINAVVEIHKRLGL